MHVCIYKESFFMHPMLIERFLRQTKFQINPDVTIGYLISELDGEKGYFPIQASMMEINIPATIEISGNIYLGEKIGTPILKMLPFTKEKPDLSYIPNYMMQSITILDNDIGKGEWYFDDDSEIIPNYKPVACSYDTFTGQFILRPKLFIMQANKNSLNPDDRISVQIV